jgi:predicted RNase H-like nuclease (RuvC/YqgF family)
MTQTKEEILKANAAVPKPQIPGVLEAMDLYAEQLTRQKDEQLEISRHNLAAGSGLIKIAESTIKGLMKQVAEKQNRIEELEKAVKYVQWWIETNNKGNNVNMDFTEIDVLSNGFVTNIMNDK